MIQSRMTVNIFFIFSLLCCFQNCKESSIVLPEPETPPVNSSKIQVVWQAPLGVTDSAIYLTEGPTIINDKITLGLSKGIQIRDKLKGEFLFLWDDWIRSSFFSSQRNQIIGNFLFANSRWNQAYLIDSENGQTIWENVIEHGEPRYNMVFGNVYQGVRDASPQNNQFNFLTQINLNSGIRDTVFTIERVNGYEPGMEPPAGWTSPFGDSLLIFLVRSLDFGGTLDEQLDMYAYNITADSVEWKLIDLDPEGSSKIGPPLIEENLVFFAGERTFYCLNAANGSLVWKRRFTDDSSGFTEGFFGSAFIKVGKYLVISPTNRNTYCFDAFTGEQLWKETDSASSPQNMVHHNGIVYTVSKGRGKLFAFDLETGEHYWREFPPNHQKNSRATFNNEIALDPETGYIYADDRFFVLCIKPYERE